MLTRSLKRMISITLLLLYIVVAANNTGVSYAHDDSMIYPLDASYEIQTGPATSPDRIFFTSTNIDGSLEQLAYVNGEIIKFNDDNYVVYPEKNLSYSAASIGCPFIENLIISPQTVNAGESLRIQFDWTGSNEGTLILSFFHTIFDQYFSVIINNPGNHVDQYAEINQYAASGEWYLDRVTFRYQYNSISYQMTGDNIKFFISNDNQDITAPVISDIDIRQEGRLVTIDFTATDDLSGFRSAMFKFTNKYDGYILYFFADDYFLTSIGVDRWRTSRMMGDSVTEGLYELTNISAQDNANNGKEYSYALGQLPYISFTYDKENLVYPDITNLTITPETVYAGEKLTIKFVLLNDDIDRLVFAFYNKEKNKSWNLTIPFLFSVGHYSITYTINQYEVSGIWKLKNKVVYKKNGSIIHHDLQSENFSFNVINTGQEDIIPPVVSDITSDIIDGKLQIDFTVTDDVSGFNQINFTFYNENNDRLYLSSVLHGVQKIGVDRYRLEFTPNEDVNEGVYQLKIIAVFDNALNLRAYRAPDVPDISFTVTHGSDLLYGDVNDDSAVDITDAMLILRHIVGISEIPESRLEQANVDGTLNDAGTPEIDISDAVLLLRYIVGLVPELPVTAQ